MNKKDLITIEDLMTKVDSYIKNPKEREKILDAYFFAKEKHMGQYRKSGEEYITHPLNVALILTSIYADSECLQAALLHDVLEDCDVTEEEFKEKFGLVVYRLVDGVTKLGRLHFSTDNEYLVEYYKKIIVGMSEDVRVIIVKLADRLHNMRTLWATPVEKQKKKSKEVLEIFAPLAHHLGIHKIKSELEDLALRYLKPTVFYDIAEKLNKTKAERDATVYEMQEEVSDLLNAHHIPHQIKGRSKSIYSIYNKLDKGKKFSDIYDLLALRVLVDEEQDCYLALGLIHSKFRPLPKRFKDYIAMPKPNMYQSLHTTVFGIDGYLFEIQIRTYEMDEIAENGIASHWAYKENNGSNKTANLQSTTTQKLQFFKEIMELSNDKMSSEEFVSSVKDEVLNNNIYVFTPKGDVIELPTGATPLDFAYKVHSEVGETTVGAIVNGNIVPLDYELKSNDIVKINTNKAAHPSIEWLNIVKSTQAKNKIKSYFSRNEKEILIERGKENLEKELRKHKLSINEFYLEKNLKEIYKNLKIDNLDDLYYYIGSGKHSPNSVINIVFSSEEEEEKPKLLKSIVKVNDTASDIIVAGIDQIKVNIASCCKPVYGDDIVGYITRGNGISIHRSNCHNLSYLDDRCIEVKWDDKRSNKYYSDLLIRTNSLENKLADIIQVTSKLGVNISSIKTISRNDAAIYEMEAVVKDKDHLDKLILDLDNLPYIISVERLIK
ncbi:MAG TPA: bifunctional (p)ppGpp synthetase/guanosine-3',5'-bis(diphosphate) 3'-pyrophosphohydrolase [Candidatus Onthousia faecavium]|nr:bifunctional (p)ppGpp synthetase/guanosine-3',5'-bis(diphosphate) 3'-pyrophosphohydrolase [Candidatus Onthousia faecavium]